MTRAEVRAAIVKSKEFDYLGHAPPLPKGRWLYADRSKEGDRRRATMRAFNLLGYAHAYADEVRRRCDRGADVFKVCAALLGRDFAETSGDTIFLVSLLQPHTFPDED